MNHRPITQKVIRAFRKLIDLELSEHRDRDQEKQKYRDTLLDLCVWLDLTTWEASPLFLDNKTAPDWVRDRTELHFLWQRAAAAFKERQEFARRIAERRWSA
jgi:hypothetical protein